MPLNSVGIVTSRDGFVYSFDEATLSARITDFLNPLKSDDIVRDKYLDSRDKLPVDTVRGLLRHEPRADSKFVRCLYRPFDTRTLFYHDAMIERSRREVMLNMLTGENLGLLATRQTRDQWDVFVTMVVTGHKSLSAYDITSLFPLYVYPNRVLAMSHQTSLFPTEQNQKGEREANLAPAFIADATAHLGLTFILDGAGDLQQTFGPEDVFHYIYAVLHSPSYRSRYAEFLKIDFPRIPITTDLDLFRALCSRGAALVRIHLLTSPALSHRTVGFPIPAANGENLVEAGHPRYVAPGENDPESGEPVETGRVYISKGNPKTGMRGQYFEGVPADIWEFHVGGYQVCEKWLKDRRGRTLNFDDITHYQKIIGALGETLRLMGEIDAAIDERGGWPLAGSEGETAVSTEVN